jgi:hypothetical protein
MTSTGAKLKAIRVKYYPPSLQLSLDHFGTPREKEVSLPPLSRLTDLSALAHKIILENPELQPRHSRKLGVSHGQRQTCPRATELPGVGQNRYPQFGNLTAMELLNTWSLSDT